MSTTVRLTEHSESLLQQQLARGPYRSPEEVIERALEALTQERVPPTQASTRSTAEALADIQDLRKGLRLDGLRINDLIHDGHRY